MSATADSPRAIAAAPVVSVIALVSVAAKYAKSTVCVPNLYSSVVNLDVSPACACT